MNSNANHIKRFKILLMFYAAMVFASPATADTASSQIFANVEGFGVSKIGTLSIKDGLEFPSTSDFEASFTFESPFASLDDYYDFRWINVQLNYVVDGVAQAIDPVNGTLPAIDPQPGNGEDANPFYYNESEWASGMAGATDIRTENVSSVFWDSPVDEQGNVIGFHLSLVVDDVAAGNFPQNTVSVLDSLVWGWVWPSDPGANPVSPFGNFLGGADWVTINQAMANAASPGFGNWQATSNLTLIYPHAIPLPLSFYLFSSGLIFIPLFKRRGTTRSVWQSRASYAQISAQ